jgi:hypothetical protein
MAAGQDESTYGFSKDDATSLANMIGMQEVEIPARRIGSSSSGGGVSLWRFTLNEAWTAGAADADILQMDGTDTGTDAGVLDPLGIFSTLESGDAGLCLLQGGNYYVIQAPCPTGT